MPRDAYLGLSLDDLLEELSAEGQAPGAGTAAGVVVALAASLVAMAARCSRASWQEAAGIASQALAIRTRALELAYEDAEAWQQALTALANVGSGGDPRRDFALERDLVRAAIVPLALAELGADAATLAATAADRCEGPVRADAVAAATLAAGAARAAAHLVESNLTVQANDPRLLRARASARAAGAAAEEALDARP